MKSSEMVFLRRTPASRFTRHLATLLFLAMAFACIFASSQDKSPSTVIINAQVADGTGAPLRDLNVRISGDRIVTIGNFKPNKDEQIIDAKASSSLRASSTFTIIPSRASKKIPSPKLRLRKASRQLSSGPMAIPRGPSLRGLILGAKTPHPSIWQSSSATPRFANKFSARITSAPQRPPRSTKWFCS